MKYAVNPEKCTGCATCSGVCPVKALWIGRETHKFTIDEPLCIGCGICYQICSYEAIFRADAEKS